MKKNKNKIYIIRLLFLNMSVLVLHTYHQIQMFNHNFLQKSKQIRRTVSLTWSDHDLVLLGANPQEGEIVLRVDVSQRAPGLHHQLVDQGRVLHRALVVQGRLDRNSWKERLQTKHVIRLQSRASSEAF